jgi:hypothetical protein
MIDVVFHLIVLWKTHEIALLHGGKILNGCWSYAHHVVCLFSIFFSSDGCVVSLRENGGKERYENSNSS